MGARVGTLVPFIFSSIGRIKDIAVEARKVSDTTDRGVVCLTHRGEFFTKSHTPTYKSPSIFQRTMESLLQGINGVCIYIEDILIPGSIKEEHLQMVAAVLQ